LEIATNRVLELAVNLILEFFIRVLGVFTSFSRFFWMILFIGFLAAEMAGFG